MFQRPLLAPLDERANRGRRRVKNVHLVLLDEAPETIGLGPVGRAFIHQRGRAVRQRPVNDITVSGHPTDVGGAPVSVFVLKIENPFAGEMSLQEIAAGRVQNAFRFSCGARSVKNEERVFAVEFFRRTVCIDSFDQLMPPVVAA